MDTNAAQGSFTWKQIRCKVKKKMWIKDLKMKQIKWKIELHSKAVYNRETNCNITYKGHNYKSHKTAQINELS